MNKMKIGEKKSTYSTYKDSARQGLIYFDKSFEENQMTRKFAKLPGTYLYSKMVKRSLELMFAAYTAKPSFKQFCIFL